MFSKKVSAAVLEAIEMAPYGVSSIDVLDSLRFCDRFTLKTTLSRLNKSGQIIRLKRGLYSTNPMKDALICAQRTLSGYLGFSTALYVHKLITEIPFTITVVTPSVSKSTAVGEYEFRSVSLKEKAVGFEWVGPYIVSTRAKTLFDSLYLPRYSIGQGKLTSVFSMAKLSNREWSEFDNYVKRFTTGAAGKAIADVKKAIMHGNKS